MKVLQMPKPDHYDFSQAVIDLNTGLPYQRTVPINVTVEDIIIGALTAADGNMLPSIGEREERLNIAEKLKKGDLEDGVKLTQEEVGLIRKACALNTPTQFYGWVMRALESKA